MADVIESRTIIAAYPGFLLVTYFELTDHPDDSHFDYQEIIGWEVERSEGPYAARLNKPGTWVHVNVTPVTLDGTPFHNPWCIKTPAGKFDSRRPRHR
jgi:hypothetical protein